MSSARLLLDAFSLRPGAAVSAAAGGRVAHIRLVAFQVVCAQRTQRSDTQGAGLGLWGAPSLAVMKLTQILIQANTRSVVARKPHSVIDKSSVVIAASNMRRLSQKCIDRLLTPTRDGMPCGFPRCFQKKDDLNGASDATQVNPASRRNSAERNGSSRSRSGSCLRSCS